MFKYGQYCPVAQSLEILGDRWTLLIVRDLLSGTTHFNALARGLPGVSKGLLSSRLKRLEEHGILERVETGGGRSTTEYLLTEAGRALNGVIASLMVWGAQWSFRDPSPEQLDPLLLMWWIKDRVSTDRLPSVRITVEFDFRLRERELYWLVMRSEDVSLCVQHPGYDVDVVVDADLATFYKVWMGRMDYADAVSTRLLQLDALPELVRDFPNWFKWSLAAETIRAARSEAA